MIISASRRTDVPRFYFDWFLNRLREGYALVRNPVNPIQVSRVELSPRVVDCIAFWSKDPAPMLARLDELDAFGYPYYLQFTINPYGRDVEGSLPPKPALVETFLALSRRLGAHRVVWRYSPVLLNSTYTPEAHLRFFDDLSAQLQGHTEICRLSFLDMYRKIRAPMARLGIAETDAQTKLSLARQFYKMAGGRGIRLTACSDPDLAAAGFPAGPCVDAALCARLAGAPLAVPPDSGQRAWCACAQSVDIGAYDTCQNGCLYCYANQSPQTVAATRRRYDPASPLLCSSPAPRDKVTTRKMASQKESQLRFD